MPGSVGGCGNRGAELQYPSCSQESISVPLPLFSKTQERGDFASGVPSPPPQMMSVDGGGDGTPTKLHMSPRDVQAKETSAPISLGVMDGASCSPARGGR